MNRELVEALELVEKEKGISKEILIDAIESALTSAYKKDQKSSHNIKVQLDPKTGDFHVYTYKMAVMEVEDESTEINLAEAKSIDPRYQEGDLVEFEIFPKEFGRIAAQTAKQVVVQRIREAERSLIYDEFSSRVGDIITGVVRRFEQRTIYVDLGRVEAILPPNEQIPGERYEPGMRIKTYLVEVKKTSKGPQIILSRAKNGLLKRLLELEIPEIQDGIVEIKSVAREPGARSKVAVYSRYENVDPVGACVGAKGSRVQMIVRELKGEKIDVIPWQPVPEIFITRAMSPARVSKVYLLPSKKTALVIVPDNQLSLAIGKEGQNARLAARLTGWKIDIKSETQAEEEREAIEAMLAAEESLRATEPVGIDDEILVDDELVEEETWEEEGFEEDLPEEGYPEEENYPEEAGEEYSEEEYPAGEYDEEEYLPIEEEAEEEETLKKKTKKRAKRKERVKDLYDEMEEGMDYFEDVVKDENHREHKAPRKETELVFSEGGTGGFTIGQLLADELKEKFNLNKKGQEKSSQSQKKRGKK